MADAPSPPFIVKIPPPIWAVALLLMAYGLKSIASPWTAGIVLQAEAAAIVIGIGGLLLAVWAVRVFIVAGAALAPHSQENKAFVTHGPFLYTRNPMYSSLLVMVFAVALYFGTLPFYAVPVLLFLLIDFVFVPFEEAQMRRQYSAPYTEYCAKVRRWV